MQFHIAWISFQLFFFPNVTASMKTIKPLWMICSRFFIPFPLDLFSISLLNQLSGIMQVVALGMHLLA
jgi:hypothetical protein